MLNHGSANYAFTVASAVCGAAQNLGELIAARALQGVGGGMLTPTGMAMLYRVYGPAQFILDPSGTPRVALAMKLAPTQ